MITINFHREINQIEPKQLTRSPSNAVNWPISGGIDVNWLKDNYTIIIKESWAQLTIVKSIKSSQKLTLSSVNAVNWPISGGIDVKLLSHHYEIQTNKIISNNYKKSNQFVKSIKSDQQLTLRLVSAVNWTISGGIDVNWLSDNCTIKANKSASKKPKRKVEYI